MYYKRMGIAIEYKNGSITHTSKQSSNQTHKDFNMEKPTSRRGVKNHGTKSSKASTITIMSTMSSLVLTRGISLIKEKKTYNNNNTRKELQQEQNKRK